MWKSRRKQQLADRGVPLLVALKQASYERAMSIAAAMALERFTLCAMAKRNKLSRERIRQITARHKRTKHHKAPLQGWLEDDPLQQMTKDDARRLMAALEVFAGSLGRDG
jgi:hypothetical protein